MPKRKLSHDESVALVLAGLKGEIPLSDLLRQYGVSHGTYYKLRDRFLESGAEGLRKGKTPKQEQEKRVKELEASLGRKTLEVELLKKASRLLGNN